MVPTVGDDCIGANRRDGHRDLINHRRTKAHKIQQHCRVRRECSDWIDNKLKETLISRSTLAADDLHAMPATHWRKVRRRVEINAHNSFVCKRPRRRVVVSYCDLGVGERQHGQHGGLAGGSVKCVAESGSGGVAQCGAIRQRCQICHVGWGVVNHGRRRFVKMPKMQCVGVRGVGRQVGEHGQRLTGDHRRRQESRLDPQRAVRSESAGVPQPERSGSGGQNVRERVGVTRRVEELERVTRG